MNIQTSVSADPDVAYEGLVEAPNQADLISRFAEIAINNGLGVCQGTDEKGAKLPGTGTDVTGKGFLGVAVYDPSKMVNWPSGTTAPYPIGQLMTVVRKGRVWVKVEEAVAVTDTPYCRVTAGGNGVGSFRKSDPGGSAAVAVPNARWVKGGSTNGLALLEINLPAA